MSFHHRHYRTATDNLYWPHEKDLWKNGQSKYSRQVCLPDRGLPYHYKLPSLDSQLLDNLFYDDSNHKLRHFHELYSGCFLPVYIRSDTVDLLFAHRPFGG